MVAVVVLVVFNLGIETVQLTLIVLLFPVFALLRRKAPTVGLFVTGAIAAIVTVFGLVWFVQRSPRAEPRSRTWVDHSRAAI